MKKTSNILKREKNLLLSYQSKIDNDYNNNNNFLMTLMQQHKYKKAWKRILSSLSIMMCRLSKCFNNYYNTYIFTKAKVQANERRMYQKLKQAIERRLQLYYFSNWRCYKCTNLSIFLWTLYVDPTKVALVQQLQLLSTCQRSQ